MTTTEADRERDDIRAFHKVAIKKGMDISGSITPPRTFLATDTNMALHFWQAALAHARRNGQENIGG